MSKKRFFYGKYYKCIEDDGYSFALIDSESNDGLAKQFITPDGSYQIEDVSQIKVTDNELIFDVSNDDITLKGSVKMSDFHPLKRSAMGPFKMLAGIMECSHDIYSMYHKLEGNIEINGIENCFFGSDFPMWSHEDELMRFLKLSFSEKENQMILADNFKAFLEIE